jgi:hypothetical protein
MTASTPRRSSHRASSTVVAVAMTMAPAALTRASSASSGRPKWKLTISGRTSSTTAHAAESNGWRIGVASPGCAPNSS